jgi:hypothetical protein
MRFEAPWDPRLRAVTALGSAVLVISAAVLLFLGFRDGDPAAAAIAAVFALGLLLVAFLARALAPTGFSIEGNAVKVLRRLRPVSIPLSRLRAAGPVRRPLARSIRLGGSGGLYGWYGRYWSRALGQFRVYATRTGNLVQLDTPDERWILSPEPAGRFLDEVLARAPGAARVPEEGPHARHPIPRRSWLRLAALVALGPAVAAAIVVVSLGWSPEGVTVDRWAITIARRWAAPVELPIASVRSVEVVGRDRVGRILKVAGFADGRGHAWGRFRSPGLGEFRLYSWNRGSWVLLETDEGNVVLTPEDCGRFVAEVRAAMAARR